MYKPKVKLHFRLVFVQKNKKNSKCLAVTNIMSTFAGRKNKENSL